MAKPGRKPSKERVLTELTGSLLERVMEDEGIDPRDKFDEIVDATTTELVDAFFSEIHLDNVPDDYRTLVNQLARELVVDALK